MSTPEEGLRDILSGSSAPVTTTPAEPVTDVKPAATPEPAATSAVKAEPETKAEEPKSTEPVRDDKGRFQKTVPQEALHAEKQKRRELEQQLAALKEQKPKTSVLEDEDKAFTERLSEATRPLQERLFKLSIKAAKNVPGREDFEDVSQAFVEAAERDPQLYESWRASDDPGEFAYTVGKQIRELADVNGDIVAYGEKKASAVRAELDKANERIKALEAEVEAARASKAELDKVPRSLNNAPASATPRSITEADDDDIKTLVRFNNSR